MLHRRVAQSLLACAALLTMASRAAAQEPAVVLLSQERLIEVQIADHAVQQTIETGTGAFDARQYDRTTTNRCPPSPFPCTPPYPDARAEATQRSFFGISATGKFELAAAGSITYYVGSDHPAPARARTRLITTFAVTRMAKYTLSADSEGNDFPGDSQTFVLDRGTVTFTLARADGTVIRHSAGPAMFSGTSYLAVGTYALIVDLAGAVTTTGGFTEHFELRLTVDDQLNSVPECSVTVGKQTYTTGEVVKARLQMRFWGRPYGSTSTPVEYMMWLRLPNDAIVPATKAGADGSFNMMLGTDSLFFFDLLGVDAEMTRGLYELGCGMVDPHSGREFDGSSALFEIQ